MREVRPKQQQAAAAAARHVLSNIEIRGTMSTIILRYNRELSLNTAAPLQLVTGAPKSFDRPVFCFCVCTVSAFWKWLCRERERGIWLYGSPATLARANPTAGDMYGWVLGGMGGGVGGQSNEKHGRLQSRGPATTDDVPQHRSWVLLLRLVVIRALVVDRGVSIAALLGRRVGGVVSHATGVGGTGFKLG